MAYEQLSRQIIDGVGGTDNIASVVHCTTRLRFKLKNENKANDQEIKKIDGVLSLVKSGGQYQVVIGNNVGDVYNTLIKVGKLNNDGAVADDYVDNKHMSLLDRFIDLISSLFNPLLGPLCATGMIKGFNALFLAMHILTNRSGTYIILNAIGDSLFYFLPVILGISSARKFKVDIYLGATIGASLCYPTIVALVNSKKTLFTLFQGSFLQSPIHTTFLGIPVISMNYTSSVIPVIIAMWFASKVQKVARRIIPNVVKTFLVPFCVLLITIPVTFLVIGPLATWLGNGISALCMMFYNLSPILAGVLIGGFWQIFVMFGLHWGFVAASMANLASKGFDPILVLSCGASFAQTGVVLAMLFQTKKEKTKSLAIPAVISGFFGVTEPAIYGLTLPRKKPFVLSCIAAAIGGGMIGLFGTKNWMMGGLGLFSIPTTIGKNGLDWSVRGYIIALLVSTLLGILLQLMFGRKSVDAPLLDEASDKLTTEVEDTNVSYNVSTTINSPLTGTVIALSDIKDDVFASGVMGKGVAIKPTIGQVVAPNAGVVQMVFPGGHAVGLITTAGTELLIHLGMDTVQLAGDGFEVLVEKGQHVLEGEALIKFDLQKIKDRGYDITSPIIITNTKKYHTVNVVAGKQVAQGDKLLNLK
ncbi:beta-glucoside-specific PTS transporter subunit IIABC [Bombilactobacillus thymidiniphilus]|uniref:Beta-glucoside-specific PTS transporter subunit IIABC n=1 Tax=Bombilactobacillus thymidiniphilus TaxID=2923363 RepID=A0ABY4PEG5_9LACO|nr:beta-glucoside-specific PTS transporter subunit IIABC [Bombilactobacillus thymidiniphilus]UQS84074.1 beta-glucoside-specific PTS transporter subunit IIABC [Bombilactobacillus thymidiniphilus]